MSKGTILYIGRFEMPDKDASAHRVLSNGKLLRELGYHVVFFGWSNDFSRFRQEKVVKSNYEGFECYEKRAYASSLDRLKSIFDASEELKLIKKMPNLQMVIAYDFPSVAMGKIFRFCKRKHLLRIVDVTEWFGRGRKNLLTQLIRILDSGYRMRFVHKRADGLIVISHYLERYYSGMTTLKLPPLIDIQSEKWLPEQTQPHEGILLIYAGSPSATKERLDSSVNAVLSLPEKCEVVLAVVGITEADFRSMYDFQIDDPDRFAKRVRFLGRMEHRQVISLIKAADYSLIVREQNRVTLAGFPTKFVESISCGTPVIATDSSDLSEYIGAYNCGRIVSFDNLKNDLEKILSLPGKPSACNDLFDYRRYAELMDEFIRKVKRNRNYGSVLEPKTQI